MKVIYEKHPVTPERKAELKGQGYKIIDARFEPVDHKPKEAEAQAGNGDKPMTLPEIKKTLTEKGIAIPEGVTKRDELKALLDAAIAAQSAQVE